MALNWWEQGLWQIFLHHWTIHAKVEFNKFPPEARLGVHSTTSDPDLRNEFKIFFPIPGVKPTCNTHLTAMESGTEIIVWSNVNVLYTIPWVHFTTFDPELRNERFTLISFMGFPAILSALQPFQISICNRKNRKFTFSNGPQLMGTMFMANLYASLHCTCKSRI